MATTIQLDESTKDELEACKRVDGESYDSVVKMLIAHYNNSEADELTTEEIRAIANEEINKHLVSEIKANLNNRDKEK